MYITILLILCHPIQCNFEVERVEKRRLVFSCFVRWKNAMVKNRYRAKQLYVFKSNAQSANKKQQVVLRMYERLTKQLISNHSCTNLY